MFRVRLKLIHHKDIFFTQGVNSSGADYAAKIDVAWIPAGFLLSLICTAVSFWSSLNIPNIFMTFLLLLFLSWQFYNKRKTYFAHDALEQCTVGDVVLLKALPERRTKHVRHELAEIVFKVGAVVDPLTGKKVAGSQYLEPLAASTENPEGSLTEKLQQLNISAAPSSPSSAS